MKNVKGRIIIHAELVLLTESLDLLQPKIAQTSNCSQNSSVSTFYRNGHQFKLAEKHFKNIQPVQQNLLHSHKMNVIINAEMFTVQKKV